MLKLRTVKIAYWVFCASKHNRKFQILTSGEIHTIRFSNFNRIRIRILFGFGKSCEYEYEQYSVLKNHPNTNTNSIRFENICRIRIRISLFGLNYSNTIRIPNYSLTSDVETLDPVLKTTIFSRQPFIVNFTFEIYKYFPNIFITWIKAKIFGFIF